MNKAIKQLLLERCVATHAKYPQYGGMFTADKWHLVVTSTELKFKGGNIPAGTVTLAKMETPKFSDMVALMSGNGNRVEYGNGIEKAHFTVIDIDQDMPRQCLTDDAAGIVFLD